MVAHPSEIFDIHYFLSVMLGIESSVLFIIHKIGWNFWHSLKYYT